MNSMDKEKLTELVYINLGRASMCWSEIPRGDFDSTKAAELGKEIMDAVEKYLENQEPGWRDPMIEHLENEIILDQENAIKTIRNDSDFVGEDDMGNSMYRHKGSTYTLDKSFKRILSINTPPPPHWWWNK